MSSSQPRVIEAAVRTLSDNAELKLAATTLLAGTSGDHSEEIIARWDAVDSKKHGPVRRWLLWGMLALASALMWLADSKEIFAYFQWVKWVMNPSSHSRPPLAQAEQRTAAHLDARGKVLVFGDPASHDIVERKEKLWQSDPENPAYFAEYAAMLQHRSLPPDFLQTARRLDPDNAWFTYLAAAEHVRNSDIPNAMALLHEARTQTKYTSYKAELLRQRIPLLPQKNLMERFDSMLSINTGIDYSYDLNDLIPALFKAVSNAGKKGDVQAFQELAKDGEHLLRGIYQDEVSSLMDEVSNAKSARILMGNIAVTAMRLNLQDEFNARKKISSDLWKRRSKARPDERHNLHPFGRLNVPPYEFTVNGKKLNLQKAGSSMFVGPTNNIRSSVLVTPLPLTEAEVKPSRLLDHEILSRFFNYICWLVMALCLGLVAAYRFRVSELSRRLAARMTELLRPADWAWIVGLGILLPFAYVMGINRLTPLGGREFSVISMAKLMPAGHFLGLLVLWLVVPVQIIRWRLARRAGGFGFSGTSRLGWVAVACAAAFVPWIGWVALTVAQRPPLVGLYSGTLALPDSVLRIELEPATRLPQLVLLGIPVLWLCWLAAQAVFGREDRQFHRAAAARALVVSSALGLGVLCLSSQAFKTAEHYWFVRDELGRMDPARPAMSVYEYRIAAQLRKEMREILHLPTP